MALFGKLRLAVRPRLTTEAYMSVGEISTTSSFLHQVRDAVWGTRGRRAVVGVIVCVLLATAILLLTSADMPTAEESARLEAANRASYYGFVHANPQPFDGTLVEGVLEVGDAQNHRGFFEDVYAYQAEDDQPFLVLLTAADFQPDLVVITPGGRHFAASILHRTDQQAAVANLRGPGTFRIVATSRAAEATGGYELSVERPSELTALAADGSIAEGNLRGTLRAGRYREAYALDLPVGNTVVITVTSTSFQPDVFILGPEGNITDQLGLERRSDSLSVVAARFTPSWSSGYTLVVTSEQPNRGGAYSVRVEGMRGVMDIVSTDPIYRTLGERSSFRNNRYLDEFRFLGGVDDVIVLEVRTSAFAPHVVLRRGERIIQEVRATGGVARIETVLNAESTYQVDVTSGAEMARGAYVLQMDVVPGPDSITADTLAPIRDHFQPVGPRAPDTLR